MSVLRVGRVEDSSGNEKINVNTFDSDGYYIRKTITQIDTANRSSGTGWTLGPTFDIIENIKGRSLLKIYYHVPMRNDSTSWGGGYIEPQVQFNGASWQSLGSSGYDGGVMRNGGATIASYSQSILIDPNMLNIFSARFWFYFRSYDGTVLWNQSHDINNRSGTAELFSENNGLQHFSHIVIDEYARYS